MKKLLYTALMGLLCFACTGDKNTPSTPQEVKNVILLIGDGMGLSQITATMIHAGQPLAIQKATVVGLQTTHSADNEVTDSSAAGTALATGEKTNNGYLGLDPQQQPLTSILKRAGKADLGTGVVATYTITDATPAAFVACHDKRFEEYRIAEDFVTYEPDLFIGGGKAFFEDREDNRNLSEELREKGYNIVYSLEDVKAHESGRIGALLADGRLPRMLGGRGDMLPDATDEALRILSQNDKGFFIMIEGSQIDGGGHDNDAEAVISETLDFDKAVGRAMAFADQNPGTLVIVTADHETGGLTIPSNTNVVLHGKLMPAEESKSTVLFSTGGHTAAMVPIFAYGTGAEIFAGIMDNTDIPKKIAALLNLPE